MKTQNHLFNIRINALIVYDLYIYAPGRQKVLSNYLFCNISHKDTKTQRKRDGFRPKNCRNDDNALVQTNIVTEKKTISSSGYNDS